MVRVAFYVVYIIPMYSAIQHKESNPNTYDLIKVMRELKYKSNLFLYKHQSPLYTDESSCSIIHEHRGADVTKAV